ncbi:MAG: glycosyltransferase family 4 protein [Acidimicrobiales bacterium]
MTAIADGPVNIRGAGEDPVGGRVLIVIDFFPPHVGGLEAVGRAQALSLVRRGHGVTVLTCLPGPGAARDEATAEGYRVRRVPVLNFIERRWGVTFPLVSPFVLFLLLREVRRADLVHIHDAFYPLSHAAFLACLLTRRPYYMTQHVAVVDHPSRLVVVVQRLIYAVMGRPMFRNAAAVVTYNSRVRDFVVGHGAVPDRVAMQHNGIDVDWFSPWPEAGKPDLRRRYGLPPDRPVVMFVGRLVPKKGARLVVEAATPEWTTVVVGEGPDVVCPVPEHVVLFGPASGTTLRDLYRLADAFVFPAVSEMFTLVMQEAMACGLPIVTSDDPAYREYDVDRDLICFVRREATALRTSITAVLKDPIRRRAMGEYSRRMAEERFSWETNYDREYVLYGLGRKDSDSEAFIGGQRLEASAAI